MLLELSKRKNLIFSPIKSNSTECKGNLSLDIALAKLDITLGNLFSARTFCASIHAV